LVDSIDPAPNSSTLLINYEKPPHNTYTKVISRPNKQPKTTTTPHLALLPLAKLSEMAMERERERVSCELGGCTPKFVLKCSKNHLVNIDA